MTVFQYHDPDGEFIPLSTGDRVLFTALAICGTVMAIDLVLAIWGML